MKGAIYKAVFDSFILVQIIYTLNKENHKKQLWCVSAPIRLWAGYSYAVQFALRWSAKFE